VTHREVFDRMVVANPSIPFRRFVALSVNMDYGMQGNTVGLSGKPKISFDEQAADLANLAKQENAKGRYELIPFYAADPRADQLLETITTKVGRGKDFRGVKLYPPMGFLPNEFPHQLYQYCQAHSIPVTSHASREGAGARGKDQKQRDLAHPKQWLDVLHQLEREWEVHQQGIFKLNLAHFADLHVWDDDWSVWIRRMLREFRGSRGVQIYSDVANDLLTKRVHLRRYHQNALRVVDGPNGVPDQVLFGTDWWNNLPSASSELYFLRQMGYDTKNAPFNASRVDQNADRFLQLG
jgi:predicted TIM-barrel fold metal-dependent hydrolase